MPLPPLLNVEEIHSRLQTIFPQGTAHRGYLVREIAAKTVFTMLYIGAIEGSDSLLGPKHVYRMSDTQAKKQDDKQREAFRVGALRSGFRPYRDRWYNDNSREPIRDETLKEGLIAIGAVTTRTDMPTTSSKPRYALHVDFADLFDPALKDEKLEEKIAQWQKKHLSAGAIARLALAKRAHSSSTDAVSVTLPNKERRNMKAGVSSEITKQVVEVFAQTFLSNPAVIWISESGDKVITQDDAMAKTIGLDIRVDRTLPDIILADIDDPMLLVFIEVVASDGPINENRRKALLEAVKQDDFPLDRILFVTAFMDRDDTVFRKAIANLAWGSFAWVASEPDHIIAMDGPRPNFIARLRDFVSE
jgi:hypothetical protein